MAEKRVSIIKAVTRPINFMVLVLLMVETLLGGMAIKFDQQRTTLIWVIVSFLSAFTIIVICLAIWKPLIFVDVYWEEMYSDRVADDIHSAMEGYLYNLNREEQIEAWQSLAEIFENQETKDKVFKGFCTRIAKRILFKVKQKNKKIR